MGCLLRVAGLCTTLDASSTNLDASFVGWGGRVSDVARRSPVTQLNNSPDESLMDVAAFFVVHRNTISVYHQMGKHAPLKAASFLSRSSVGEPKLRQS